MSLSDALAVLGATLGTASFLWSLESFRRSGARIRVRALYCSGELDLAVVNAGRAADAVVHVFLGGVRVGDGVELSSHLNPLLSQPLSPATPFPVEAARPLLVRVPLEADVPAHLLRRAAAGFESVHLSLGSLSTARADVIPVRRMNPAAAWSPRPLVSRLRRFGPLVGATIALAAAEVSPDLVDGVRTVLAIMGVVLGLGYLWSMPRRETYRRARLERWATLGMLLAALIWTGSVYTPPGSPAENRLLLLPPLLAIGVLFAIPTAAATLWLGSHQIWVRLSSRIGRS